MEGINPKDIEYICFEGGGIKGYAYTGAIEELDNLGLLNKLKGAAGSSIGSLFATVLILGLNAGEIRNITDRLNVREYNSCCPCYLWNIWRNYGINNLKHLEVEFRKIIKQRYNPDITFKELYDKTQKELVIVTTCLNRKLPVYLHHSKFPNVKLIDGLLSSISVPFGFKPRKYDFLGTQDYYIDGAIVDNYPLWVFNEINALYEGDFTQVDKMNINPHTIGLKVLSGDQEHTYYVYKERTNIDNIVTFSKHVVDTFLLQSERSGISESYLQQTIAIPTFNISFLDFSITDDEKKCLRESGINSVDKYYNIERT